jgi:hypothetical protein
MRLYLRSGGKANTLNGDGRLTADAAPASEAADRYRYDPMNPVQTIGGGDCCNGGMVIPGAFDQRPVEARGDVLVYTSDPLPKPVDVAGFVDAVLKVSSSAKDTDFAVKLVDVAPDGTAWIIGDTIFRARYRDGYEKPAMMEAGQVYTIHPTPIAIGGPLRYGPPDPGRGHFVQLPEIRAQPEHRRAERKREGWRRRRQCDPPRRRQAKLHRSPCAAVKRHPQSLTKATTMSSMKKWSAEFLFWPRPFPASA